MADSSFTAAEPLPTAPLAEREVIAPPDGRCIHVDMENARYHATGNWPHSQLKWLPVDPETFEWRYISRREEFSATRPMVCGSAFHAWLLEGIEPTIVPPEFLNKAGAVRPGGWDDIADAFPGVPVIKESERKALAYARDRCYADREIRAYLKTAGHVEHSLFAVDQETGLPTKVRLDKLCEFRSGIQILDLKFARGVDDRSVESQITNMAYYRQAGFYWEHAERAYQAPQRWVFLFVMNKPPFTARLKYLLPPDIELGQRHEHIALRALRRRLTENDWNGDGYGEVRQTGVAHWMWEKGLDDEGAVFAPLEEFAAFSGENE